MNNVEIDELLAIWSEHQKQVFANPDDCTDTSLVCPRCGRELDPKYNCLSRCTGDYEIYVCENCGADEAMANFEFFNSGTELPPLSNWSLVVNKDNFLAGIYDESLVMEYSKFIKTCLLSNLPQTVCSSENFYCIDGDELISKNNTIIVSDVNDNENLNTEQNIVLSCKSAKQITALNDNTDIIIESLIDANVDCHGDFCMLYADTAIDTNIAFTGFSPNIKIGSGKGLTINVTKDSAKISVNAYDTKIYCTGKNSQIECYGERNFIILSSRYSTIKASGSAIIVAYDIGMAAPHHPNVFIVDGEDIKENTLYLVDTNAEGIVYLKEVANN